MKKNNNKKGLIVGGVILAAGGIGFLGYRWFRNQQTKEEADELRKSLLDNSSNDVSPLVAASVSAQTSPSRINSSGFPLKRGSKGELVRQLQQAIIQKYGNEALPRFGVDGIYGREVEAFLVSKGLPRQVDIATFSKIMATPKQESPAVSLTKVGNSLAKATQHYGMESRKPNPDFDRKTRFWKTVQKELKHLFKPEHYEVASSAYKQHRILGVRRTLVTGLLTVFTSRSQREHLEKEFLRMGLLKSGTKWRLPN